MCTTCGCGESGTLIEGDAHEHAHADGTVHSHAHGHSHGQVRIGAEITASAEEAGLLHFGMGAAGAHAPGMSQARMVRIEQDILGKNDAYAAENRRRFAERAIFAVNLVSSPGAGKTTLLVRTIEALAGRLPVAVIEGDQQTSVDAERIRATGAPAIQVNTGKGCHLDALMVSRAIARLAPADGTLLLIENVGNLVCPADFDLGEAHKVVILSVTEGEDKPLKYPNMFRAANLMILHKTDLLPYVAFDVEKCIAHARRVNPAIGVLQLSSMSGVGLDPWLEWLARGAHAARVARERAIDRLQRRVVELEAEFAPTQG
ncbi:MAG: hydrogenase nickel incorporation protein HypB [Betaproteobacteria bacterium]|nr:hydrogenase nickel incorporation protein HypB [Betaproteobacteria bacterium]